MKGTEMFDAMAHIDEDLIDRCIDASPSTFDAQKASARRRAIRSFAAIAAAAVVMVGLIYVLHLGGKSPKLPPVTGDPTAAPTEQPTEQPTEAPTEEPTPDPLAAYDEHDYTVLRDFFEQKDENGVTNGSKLFPDYDPADPATWNDEDPYRYNEVGWNDQGRLSSLYFRGTDDAPIALSGKLDLSGFDRLYGADAWNVTLDSVDASGIGSASNMKLHNIQFPLVKDEAYFSGGYAERIGMLSAKHVLIDMTGDMAVSTWLPDTFGLRIDVTTEGEGYAGVSAWDDENDYEVRLKACPLAGHTFVGWFDTEGNLVSTEDVYELFGEDTEKNVMEAKWDLAFTARFD